MNFKGQYLNYEEYKNLGGTLEGEVPFNLLEYDARKKIDERTFGRLTKLENVPYEVKMCVFKMIEISNEYKSLETHNKAIASENTDGYSISYHKLEITDIDVKKSELENIMKTYLSNVIVNNIPVLYRGIDKC